MRLLLFLPFLLLATPALAGDPPDEAAEATPEVQYKAVTDIVIDDVRVDGGITRPMGHFGLEKRRATFNPLLKLRADFDREMVLSVDAIR